MPKRNLNYSLLKLARLSGWVLLPLMLVYLATGFALCGHFGFSRLIDLQTALRLLSLPRTLGADPISQEPVIASNGRYGPYIKCASETRSLPADMSPLDVTLETALQLLAQPKTRGGRTSAPREPIKQFEASPVTGEPVKLLSGRYGPYVTDGTTNASLPKATEPEEVTLEVALQLLADRAARGPTRRRTKKKTTTAKKSTAKKKTKKKAATKKTTKKKTASKKTPKKS